MNEAALLGQASTDRMMAIGLAATRLAAFLMASPVLGFATLPARIRIIVVLVLASAIAGGTGFAAPALAGSAPFQVVMMFATEAFLGAAMGFGLLAAFGSLMIAGRMFDYQVGFAAALMFDPTTRQQSPLFGTLLVMVGALLFLTVDGHHAVIRAVAWSMSAAPPMGWTYSDDLMKTVMAHAGLLFAYGFALVAPSLAALMLVDVGVAVSARTMPQVNAYFVALPAKVFVGILVLAMSLPVSEKMITGMFSAALPSPDIPIGGR